MSTRIKGKSAIFEVDGVDYAGDITSIVLENEAADADVTTFADAAAGGAVEWKFSITAVQSTDTGSLWNYLWTAAGDTDVPFTYGPQGNETPSTAKPHFTGTLDLGPKPSIGGDADATWTFDVELKVNGEPTRVTV